jgi:chemotaxis signal transduction protein
VILFRVGESTFAIAASAVDEIRNTQGIKPAPDAELATGGTVRHTLVRNGRKYFVVDATAHFQMLPARATRLLVLRDAAVAVLVGDIDRMTELGEAIHVLPRAFRGAERNWYRGLAVLEYGGVVQVVPVVNPESLLGKADMQPCRS